MRRSLRLSLAAAGLVALAGCLDAPSPFTPICPQVQIPALTGDTVTTASGLRYFNVLQGSGPTAQPAHTVTVHYTGYLVDGTRFDTSRGGSPRSFALSQVIPGFREGISGMQVGGVRRLIIPPQLGYGTTPRDCIPANSTLIFDVELLGVTGN